jgi:hypothetical protein
MRSAAILTMVCAVFSVPAGCAAPSRRLTVRLVDDPIVNPRGLMTLGGGASWERDSNGQSSNSPQLPFLRYGITDRLELNGLGLGFGFLDDAPAAAPATMPPKARTPLALAVRGGLNGIGYSSSEELIVLPTIVVSGRKHLGRWVVLGGNAHWNAFWTASPKTRDVPYSPTLWPRAGRVSEVGLGAGVTVQLVDHLALAAGVGVHELRACMVPTCAWAARGGTLSLGPSFRPWNWLTVGVWAFAGGRYRPADPVTDPTMPMNPDALPHDANWIGAGGDFAFSF